MLLHVRISLPDRPGALAALSHALASKGADIVSISVLDHEAGRVVDDVYVTCSAGRSDVVLLGITAVAGASLIGMRVAERPPGPLADLFLLEQLLHAPWRGLETLVDTLPHVLGADWAVASRGAHCLAQSLGAPKSLRLPAVPSRPVGTVDDGEARLIAALGVADAVVIIGRSGSFPFHRTEFAHVGQLLAVAATVLSAAVPSYAPDLDVPTG